MGLSCTERSDITPLAGPKGLNGAQALLDRAPLDPQPGTEGGNRARQRHAPVRLEAAVYWWRTDEPKTACANNQFGIMPATPVRFRCIGTLMPKYPRRFRVELAQAIDFLPELTRRELRQLGLSLAAAIGNILDVEVAPFNGDVIDLSLAGTGGQ